MSWIVVEKYIERETHSGAFEMLNKIAIDRGISVQEKGPGSCGTVFLPERGTCNYFQRYSKEK